VHAPFELPVFPTTIDRGTSSTSWGLWVGEVPFMKYSGRCLDALLRQTYNPRRRERRRISIATSSPTFAIRKIGFAMCFQQFIERKKRLAGAGHLAVENVFELPLAYIAEGSRSGFPEGPLERLLRIVRTGGAAPGIIPTSSSLAASSNAWR